MNKSFIAIDWSSTHFKAYRIDGSGYILDKIITEQGIAKITRIEIADIIEQLVLKWPEEQHNMYCSGMIGSNLGWETLSYIQCPVVPEGFSLTLPQMNIGEHILHVSPGLTCNAPYHLPDVMRGEEMLYLGYLYQQNDYVNTTGIVCIPGKHSKWLSVKNGVAEYFSTVMTGDILFAMSKNGLLKSHLNGLVEDAGAFLEGVNNAKSGDGLSRLLFSVRSRVVTNNLINTDATSYAMGLLVGSELADIIKGYAKSFQFGPVTLIGDDLTCSLYQSALKVFGYESIIIAAHEARINGFKFIHSMRNKDIE